MAVTKNSVHTDSVIRSTILKMGFAIGFITGGVMVGELPVAPISTFHLMCERRLRRLPWCVPAAFSTKTGTFDALTKLL